MTKRSRPAWELSGQELRAKASRLSAGKNLCPGRWPGDAKVAVLFSFDVDTQTWELMDGGEPSLRGLAQGEYGARVGLPRIVRLLDRHEIPATFFVPAVSVLLHPGIADVINESGRHEVGVHGWIHEHPNDLSSDTERELMERSVATLTEHFGMRPVGYRAPAYEMSVSTVGLLQDFGFLYDSSMMADDRPYELNENGAPTGIVELPVDWIRDDATLLDPLGDNYTPPRELLRVYLDELDKAYEEGTMLLLPMHPRAMGHRSRIVILEELIERIQTRGRAWFATHREAAEYVKSQCLEG